MSRGASKTTLPLVRKVATSSAPAAANSSFSSALETRWFLPTFTPRRNPAYLMPSGFQNSRQRDVHPDRGARSGSRVREPEPCASAGGLRALHSIRARAQDRRAQGLAPDVRLGAARPP